MGSAARRRGLPGPPGHGQGRASRPVIGATRPSTATWPPPGPRATGKPSHGLGLPGGPPPGRGQGGQGQRRERRRRPPLGPRAWPTAPIDHQRGGAPKLVAAGTERGRRLPRRVLLGGSYPPRGLRPLRPRQLRLLLPRRRHRPERRPPPHHPRAAVTASRWVPATRAGGPPLPLPGAAATNAASSWQSLHHYTGLSANPDLISTDTYSSGQAFSLDERYSPLVPLHGPTTLDAVHLRTTS